MLAFSEDFWVVVAGATIAAVSAIAVELVRKGRTARIEKTANATFAETQTNGGSSMRDEIKLLLRTTQNIESRIATMDKRQLSHEERVTQVDRSLINLSERFSELSGFSQDTRHKIEELFVRVTAHEESGDTILKDS
jgi:hypothetical protein